MKSAGKPGEHRSAKQCQAVRFQSGSFLGSGGGLQRERLEAMRSAVILAGGNSRRLGAEKSLLEFEERPLICWTAEKLSLAADEVVVVARDEAHAGRLEEIICRICSRA